MKTIYSVVKRFVMFMVQGSIEMNLFFLSLFGNVIRGEVVLFTRREEQLSCDDFTGSYIASHIRYTFYKVGGVYFTVIENLTDDTVEYLKEQHSVKSLIKYLKLKTLYDVIRDYVADPVGTTVKYQVVHNDKSYPILSQIVGTVERDTATVSYEMIDNDTMVISILEKEEDGVHLVAIPYRVLREYVADNMTYIHKYVKHTCGSIVEFSGVK